MIHPLAEKIVKEWSGPNQDWSLDEMIRKWLEEKCIVLEKHQTQITLRELLELEGKKEWCCHWDWLGSNWYPQRVGMGKALYYCPQCGTKKP